MYLLLLRRRSRRSMRRERIFRDRSNPFDFMHENLFIARYRFPKHVFTFLCSLLVSLQPSCRQSQPLPVSLQLCITLHFFAQGGYLSHAGDIHNVR